MFRNTGANAFAKNQMRLAYEDKRDLYCMSAGIPIEMLCWRNQRKKQYFFKAFDINLYKTQ